MGWAFESQLVLAVQRQKGTPCQPPGQYSSIEDSVDYFPGSVGLNSLKEVADLFGSEPCSKGGQTSDNKIEKIYRKQ